MLGLKRFCTVLPAASVNEASSGSPPLLSRSTEPRWRHVSTLVTSNGRRQAARRLWRQRGLIVWQTGPNSPAQP